MEIQGKIIAVLPVRSGKTAKGSWMSQQYVLETDDRYPKRLLFELFGEKTISEYAIKEGEIVTVTYDPHADERNGRWYGSNRAWDVKRV